MTPDEPKREGWFWLASAVLIAGWILVSVALGLLVGCAAAWITK